MPQPEPAAARQAMALYLHVETRQYTIHLQAMRPPYSISLSLPFPRFLVRIGLAMALYLHVETRQYTIHLQAMRPPYSISLSLPFPRFLVRIGSFRSLSGSDYYE